MGVGLDEIIASAVGTLAVVVALLWSYCGERR